MQFQKRPEPTFQHFARVALALDVFHASFVFLCISMKRYWNDFHSGMSSFHLHIFLCICLHDTVTKFFFPYKSFWNDFIPANRVVRASGTCVLFSRWRERLRLSQSVLSCECSTNFILVRNSFQYHVNSP